MDLFIIIVLYNKGIEDIRSFHLFNKLAVHKPNIKIIICDNSTSDFSELNSKTIQQKYPYIKYFCNFENIGLAKSYNKAIEYIKMISRDYYVMFSDDDTDFSEEYLRNVLSACLQRSGSIFSGIIYSGRKVFSPRNSMSLLKKGFIEEPGLYHDIVCVNSGLVLEHKIIEKIGMFNENFFVDMIDYWLMYTLHKKNLCDITILSGGIYQDFSGDSSDDLIKMSNRYNIYKNDCLVFGREFPKQRFSVWALILKRWLKIEFYKLRLRE